MMPRLMPVEAPRSSALKMTNLSGAFAEFKLSFSLGCRKECDRDSSQARTSKKVAYYALGGKILRGNFPGRSAMGIVVSLDGINRREDIIESLEAEQTSAYRQDAAETGVLRYDRPSGG